MQFCEMENSSWLPVVWKSRCLKPKWSPMQRFSYALNCDSLIFPGFLLPLLENLRKLQESGREIPAPLAVVLVPTSDLAYQVGILLIHAHFQTLFVPICWRVYWVILNCYQVSCQLLRPFYTWFTSVHIQKQSKVHYSNCGILQHMFMWWMRALHTT